MTLETFLARRSPNVAERIARLNPNPQPGQFLRGWQPSKAKYGRLAGDLIGKRAFLRIFERRHWDALPNGLKIRHGRRKYVARETFEDDAPLLYAGDVMPGPMIAWFPTKRYANDPACVRELRKVASWGKGRPLAPGDML